MSKEERYERVAEVVARLLLHGGIDDVRFATVARKAGVSRAWLYKYFGTEPAELAAYAVRAWGARFTEAERSRPSSDVHSWLRHVDEGTRQGLADAVAAPWVMALYIRHRVSPDLLGDEMRVVEARHIDRFVADMPPELRREEGRARAFAALFAAARVGVFHRWTDPRWREAVREDEVVTGLMAMVEAFAHAGAR